MKKCTGCNIEYDDDVILCPKCGGKTTDEIKICASCGHVLEPDSNFCPKCGAKAGEIRECPICHAKLSAGSSFCANCGSMIGAASRNNGEDRSAKKRGSGVREFCDKVIGFERKRHIISNAVVIMLAVVVLFVSLFAPIKVSASSFFGYAGNSDIAFIDIEQETLDQSIFQVLAAFGYINLDTNDADDSKKASEVEKEFENRVAQAEIDYDKWLSSHPKATEEQKQAKQQELIMQCISDCNIFALLLVVTEFYKVLLEQFDMNIDALRGETIASMILALFLSIVHFVLAIISIVFIVLAIIGMVKKHTASAPAYFKTALVLSGVGLILLSLAPLLVSLGGTFAVALTVALTSFAYGVCRGLVCGKSVACVIKRTVCAALAITSFFLFCGYIVNTTVVMSMSVNGMVVSVDASETVTLGEVLGSLIASVCMTEIGDYSIVYPKLSVVTAVFALILFTLAIILMLLWLVTSLTTLVRDPEQQDKVQALPIVAASVIAITAIVVGSMSAAANSLDIGSSKLALMGIAFRFFAGVQMYVALGLAVANVVFAALFCPKPKQKPDEPDRTRSAGEQSLAQRPDPAEQQAIPENPQTASV